VRSWIFRNRRRLEAIYGAAGRSRPLTEPLERSARGAGLRPGSLRVRIRELIPRPRQRAA
jgi:hypothetical protein